MLELFPWQQDLWQQWRQRREIGRLPHSLLLSGPEGLGKRQFADYLSQSLVCTQNAQEPCGVCQACELTSVGNHPDIHKIAPEESGKMIKVDVIRQLIHQASLTAPTWRVFIVNPADTMNIAASNALLKTLEEPTPNTLLILISAMPQRLPATIRSRCQDFTFRPVEQSQALHWLQAQQADVNWADELAYVGNQPLLALQAHQEHWLNEAQQILEQLIALQARRVNPMQVAKDWVNYPVQKMFKVLRCICSDLLHLSTANAQGRLFFPSRQTLLQPLARQIKAQALFRYQDQLNQLDAQLQHNLNPAMLMEKLVVAWLGSVDV